MPKKWQHPIHTRGVKARVYDSPVHGDLTDLAIEHYLLDGHYGEEARLRCELYWTWMFAFFLVRKPKKYSIRPVPPSQSSYQIVINLSDLL